MSVAGAVSPAATLAQLIEDGRVRLTKLRGELREIETLVSQATSEGERLSKRNTAIASRLQHIEANLAAQKPEDVQEAYAAAQESQLRLFTARGQVEQLEIKRDALAEEAAHLERLLTAIASMEGLADGGGDGLSPVIRVIEAQEGERKRLARQMHDGPAQSLTNLILQAEICERLLNTDPDQLRAELTNLKDTVNATFQRTRQFIFDLRPMMLDDLGLLPTVRRYAQDFQEKTGIGVDLNIIGQERRFAPHTEVTIFRVIQELMHNVESHAQASQVKVILNLEGEDVAISVEDDGSGFDVDNVMAEAEQKKATGLDALRDRLVMMDGAMEIASDVGQGSRVDIRLPAS
ncbi:MAG: histidine kinase [Anaerolineae bacterium]